MTDAWLACTYFVLIMSRLGNYFCCRSAQNEQQASFLFCFPCSALLMSLSSDRSSAHFSPHQKMAVELLTLRRPDAGRNLLVTGMAPETTYLDLWRIFRRFGLLYEIQLKERAPGDVTHAFVKYHARAAAARAAATVHRQIIVRGRRLRAVFARRQRRVQSCEGTQVTQMQIQGSGSPHATSSTTRRLASAPSPRVGTAVHEADVAAATARLTLEAAAIEGEAGPDANGPALGPDQQLHVLRHFLGCNAVSVTVVHEGFAQLDGLLNVRSPTLYATNAAGQPLQPPPALTPEEESAEATPVLALRADIVGLDVPFYGAAWAWDVRQALLKRENATRNMSDGLGRMEARRVARRVAMGTLLRDVSEWKGLSVPGPALLRVTVAPVLIAE